jgi:uncharacterized membrane protein
MTNEPAPPLASSSPAPNPFSGDPQVAAAPSISGTAFTIIRNRMIAGMVVLLPIFLTVYVMMGLGHWLYSLTRDYLHDDIKSLIQQAPFLAYVANDYVIYVAVILVSIFIILSTLYLTGLLMAVYAVKRIVSIGEWIIGKIPIISFVYNLVKQTIATLAMQNEGKANSAKKVVLVEFPRTGVWSVAFATGETFIDNTGESFVNVFMPSTPNPTTGFMMMLPARSIRETNMTIEQASKFLLSFGIMAPTGLLTRELKMDGGAMPPAVMTPVADALQREGTPGAQPGDTTSRLGL